MPTLPTFLFWYGLFAVAMVVVGVMTPQGRAALRGERYVRPERPRPMSLKDQRPPRSEFDQMLHNWRMSMAVVFFTVLLGGPLLAYFFKP